MVDISKLKGLVSVKKVITNSDNSNKRNRSNKKTSHAIKCEVFFYKDSWYGIKDNDRYPIEITDQDYLNAKYLFSNSENENWKLHTIKPFNSTESALESVKKYWNVIIPESKVYITVENGIGKLCMDMINDRNEKLYKKLSPKYYATRRN